MLLRLADFGPQKHPGEARTALDLGLYFGVTQYL
jgi:hypothetical protein